MSIFEHDCGMDDRSWHIRAVHDFGEEGAVLFEAEVDALTELLERIEATAEPDMNTDLLFHQLFPDLYPDPFEEKAGGKTLVLWYSY